MGYNFLTKSVTTTNLMLLKMANANEGKCELTLSGKNTVTNWRKMRLSSNVGLHAHIAYVLQNCTKLDLKLIIKSYLIKLKK